MTPNPSLPAAPVEAAQPSDEQIVLTVAERDKARALIYECTATDLLSGDRPAKRGDRQRVYAKLIAAADLLIGDFAPHGVLVEPADLRDLANFRELCRLAWGKPLGDDGHHELAFPTFCVRVPGALWATPELVVDAALKGRYIVSAAPAVPLGVTEDLPHCVVCDKPRDPNCPTCGQHSYQTARVGKFPDAPSGGSGSGSD